MESKEQTLLEEAKQMARNAKALDKARSKFGGWSGIVYDTLMHKQYEIERDLVKMLAKEETETNED